MPSYCDYSPQEELIGSLRSLMENFGLSKQELAVLLMRVGNDLLDPGSDTFDLLRSRRSVRLAGSVWEPDTKGANAYSVEMSRLQGYELIDEENFMTEFGTVPVKSLTAHRDRENDITHWSAIAYDNHWIIWND